MSSLSKNQRNEAMGMLIEGLSVLQIARQISCFPSTFSKLPQMIELTGNVMTNHAQA